MSNIESVRVAYTITEVVEKTHEIVLEITDQDLINEYIDSDGDLDSDGLSNFIANEVEEEGYFDGSKLEAEKYGNIVDSTEDDDGSNDNYEITDMNVEEVTYSDEDEEEEDNE